MVLGELDNTEKSGLGSIKERTVCVLPDARLEATGEKGPSTKLGFHKAGLEPEYKSRRRYVFGIYEEKEVVVDSENAALQKGWDCKAKELCVSARRPPLFFSVSVR